MIIACPECTGPFELTDDNVAELVQIECPHCRFRMILDFAAANDPSLIETGMQMASGFRSAADYRASVTPPAAAPPLRPVEEAPAAEPAEPARPAAPAPAARAPAAITPSPAPARPAQRPASTAPAASRPRPAVAKPRTGKTVVGPLPGPPGPAPARPEAEPETGTEAAEAERDVTRDSSEIDVSAMPSTPAEEPGFQPAEAGAPEPVSEPEPEPVAKPEPAIRVERPAPAAPVSAAARETIEVDPPVAAEARRPAPHTPPARAATVAAAEDEAPPIPTAASSTELEAPRSSPVGTFILALLVLLAISVVGASLVFEGTPDPRPLLEDVLRR